MNGVKLGKAPLIIIPTGADKNRQAALKERQAELGGLSRISVSNLPFSVTAVELTGLFKPFADECKTVIKDCAIFPDSQGRGSSGTGFVDFELKEAAMMSVAQMNNFQLGDRNIKVSLAVGGVAASAQPGLPVPVGGGLLPMPGMPGANPFAMLSGLAPNTAGPATTPLDNVSSRATRSDNCADAAVIVLHPSRSEADCVCP